MINLFLCTQVLNFKIDNPLDDRRAMIWIRAWQLGMNKDWLGDRIIIHGHSPIKVIDIKRLRDNMYTNQYLNIDSGCYYSTQEYEHLCCFQIETNQLFFEKKIDFD